jgi:hypothetical protein
MNLKGLGRATAGGVFLVVTLPEKIFGLGTYLA